MSAGKILIDMIDDFAYTLSFLESYLMVGR